MPRVYTSSETSASAGCHVAAPLLHVRFALASTKPRMATEDSELSKSLYGPIHRLGFLLSPQSQTRLDPIIRTTAKRQLVDLTFEVNKLLGAYTNPNGTLGERVSRQAQCRKDGQVLLAELVALLTRVHQVSCLNCRKRTLIAVDSAAGGFQSVLRATPRSPPIDFAPRSRPSKSDRGVSSTTGFS